LHLGLLVNAMRGGLGSRGRALGANVERVRSKGTNEEGIREFLVPDRSWCIVGKGPVPVFQKSVVQRVGLRRAPRCLVPTVSPLYKSFTS